MKRVLFVAYYFPPALRSASVRAINFVKHLPSYGWTPYILTVKDSYSSSVDMSLLNQVSQDISIYRAMSLEPRKVVKSTLRTLNSKVTQEMQPKFEKPSPKPLKKFSQFVRAWFIIPDEQLFWLPHAVHLGQKIINENAIDAIITTAGPYTSHLIGLLLKRWKHVPWIADFRDNWTRNSCLKFPTGLHRRTHKFLELCVLKGAERVTTVQPDLYVGTDCDIRDKILHLTNGFEEDDFKDLDRSSDTERLTIVYAGSFYRDRNLAFVEAVKILLKDSPKIRSRIKVKLFGRSFDIDIEREIKNRGVEDVFSLEGTAPRSQILQQLVNADVLLLILGKDQKTVYSGKLFEYLGARRPILGLVPPDGLAAQVIRDCRSGVVVPPADVGAIKDALTRLYDKWQAGALHKTPGENIERFDYKRIVKRLAGALDSIA